MAQPNGETTDSTDTGTASGGTGESASGAGTGEGTTGTTSTGASGTPETVAKAEHDAVVARMKAADQRAAKVEAELKAIRDKDLPAQEKLAKDHAELVKSHEALVQQNRQTVIENAFLKANTFKWKDPEAALKLADLSGVEIGDDGKVTGMEQALKTLATSKKWLLEEGDGSGAGDSGSDSNSGTGTSGAAPTMGAGATNRGNQTDKGKLKKTYSALRMRG